MRVFTFHYYDNFEDGAKTAGGQPARGGAKLGAREMTFDGNGWPVISSTPWDVCDLTGCDGGSVSNVCADPVGNNGGGDDDDDEGEDEGEGSSGGCGGGCIGGIIGGCFVPTLLCILWLSGQFESKGCPSPFKKGAKPAKGMESAA